MENLTILGSETTGLINGIYDVLYPRPLLSPIIIWFNFNFIRNRNSHPFSSLQWNHISWTKLQPRRWWNSGMDKHFRAIYYCTCDYLSMFELKFVHVDKRGHVVKQKCYLAVKIFASVNEMWVLLAQRNLSQHHACPIYCRKSVGYGFTLARCITWIRSATTKYFCYAF